MLIFPCEEFFVYFSAYQTVPISYGETNSPLSPVNPGGIRKWVGSSTDKIQLYKKDLF